MCIIMYSVHCTLPVYPVYNNVHSPEYNNIHFLYVQLVSGSFDCTIKFWDLKKKQCTRTIDWKDSEGHTAVVRLEQLRRLKLG